MSDGTAEEAGGTQLDFVRFQLDRSKLLELARAFKDEDPVWYEQEAAARAGFAEIPVPPTATAIADHWRKLGATFHAETLGLDLKRLLHGEASWEFVRPLRAGEELAAVSELVGVETREGKRGGEMKLVRVATTFLDADGEVAARRVDVLIETAPR